MHKYALIILSLFLTGCDHFKKNQDYFRNRAEDYHSSQLVAPLKVPSDLAQLSKAEQYPIPENLPEGETTVNLDPPFFERPEEVE